MDKNELEKRENVSYNQIKIETLDLIENMGEATTHEVAELTGRRYEAASMAMLQYHRYGLLHRRKLERGAYSYSITERGIERLEWLKREL